ncbi:MAG: response regulator transcription factor [Bacteroidetes bacterium]|nr:response regulator transcription factor [Bacteroidota bacterium]
MDKIKVILVDDHPLVLEGLQVVLSGEPHIDVIDTATDAEELFIKLQKHQPDILILDISLPTLSGIEITQIISKQYPGIKVLILTAILEEEVVAASLAAGAKGYLPKNSPNDELITAIQKIHSGQDYLGEPIAERVIRDYLKKVKSGHGSNHSAKPVLSDREIEIVRLIAEGLTYKEIGEQLFISARTVEAHKNNILLKLNLNTIADLIKYAIKNKYTDL